MKERRPLRFQRSCPALSLGILTWSYYDGNTRKNVREIFCHRERNGLIEHSLGFPSGSVVKNQPVNAGDTDSVPDLGRPHLPQINQASAPQLLSLQLSLPASAAEIHAPQSRRSAARGAPLSSARSTAREQLPLTVRRAGDAAQPSRPLRPLLLLPSVSDVKGDNVQRNKW